MPTVLQTSPQHVAALEELQGIVFPTLSAEERLRAPQYLRHLEVFPQGQLVLMEGDRLIGMTTTMRSDFDLGDCPHTFSETSGGG